MLFLLRRNCKAPSFATSPSEKLCTCLSQEGKLAPMKLSPSGCNSAVTNFSTQ